MSVVGALSTSRTTVGQRFASGRSSWQAAPLATDFAAAVSGGTSIVLWDVDFAATPNRLLGGGARLGSRAVTVEPFGLYRENLPGAFVLACLGQSGTYEVGISTPTAWNTIATATGPFKACASADEPTELAVWSPDAQDTVTRYQVDPYAGGQVTQTGTVALPPVAPGRDVRSIALSHDLVALAYASGNAVVETIVAVDLNTGVATQVATGVRGARIAASLVHLVWSAEFTIKPAPSSCPGVELYYWTPGATADRLFTRGGTHPAVDLCFPFAAGDILAFVAGWRQQPSTSRARRKTVLFLYRLNDLLAGDTRPDEIGDDVIWNDLVAPYAIAPSLIQAGVALVYMSRPRPGEPRSPHLSHLRVV